MIWTAEQKTYAECLRDQGCTQKKIASCVTNRFGVAVSEKAVERMFARRRCEDIPIIWDDTPTTEVEVPRPHMVANDNGLDRMLIVPDCHFPFVDRRCWNLMMDVARYIRPRYIVTLGDFIDCESISSHDRDLSKPKVTLREEFDSGNAALDELDGLGAEHRFALMGNHEARSISYVARKCPELYGMLDVSKELHYRERGWSVTEYKDYVQIGDTFFTHDEGNAGQYAHLKARDTFGSGNCVIGHTHRSSFAQCTAIDGTPRWTAMLGWLGSTDNIKYQHRAKLRFWQHAFGVASIERTGRTHLQVANINNGACVVDGRLFRAASMAA